MNTEASGAAPRWAVLLVMCAGYFLVLLDVTIVNVALPRISAGLGANVSSLQWVVDGYAIALAALMLTGAPWEIDGVKSGSSWWGSRCSARPPWDAGSPARSGCWSPSEYFKASGRR